MAASFALKAAGSAAKPRLLAKFRDPMPSLDPRPGEPPAATLTRQQPVAGKTAYRQGRTPDPIYTLRAPENKTFEGTKEAAGGGASSYVLLRVEAGDGRAGPRNVQVVPVEEWVSFRPSITYETLDIDEAEKALQQNDFRGSKSDSRLAGLRKGSRGEGGAAEEPMAEGFEEDLFDDGAEEMNGGFGTVTGWEEEDGREGLDVEDEEMFDDDEDEYFEEDEGAAGARAEAAKLAVHEAARVRLGPTAEDPEEELEGDKPEETGEWKTFQKKMLQMERRERRAMEEPGEEDEEDEEDDEEDAEGGKEALRRILGNTRRQGDADDEAAAGAAAPADETPKGGKRKAAAAASIGEGGASGSKDVDSKRARTTAASSLPPPAAPAPAPAPAAAAPSAAPSRHRVSQRDVVMLLHEKGAMNLRELTSYFKEFNKSADEKKHLQEIIKRVAKLDKRGGVAHAVLKEATIFEYKLTAK